MQPGRDGLRRETDVPQVDFLVTAPDKGFAHRVLIEAELPDGDRPIPQRGLDGQLDLILEHGMKRGELVDLAPSVPGDHVDDAPQG